MATAFLNPELWWWRVPGEKPQNKETTEKNANPMLCSEVTSAITWVWILSDLPCLHLTHTCTRTSTHTRTHTVLSSQKWGHIPQIYSGSFIFTATYSSTMRIDHSLFVHSSWLAFRLFWSFAKIAMGILVYQCKRSLRFILEWHGWDVAWVHL